MSKLISLDDAVNLVRDGDTVMVGGFLGVGTPERLIDALIAKGGAEKQAGDHPHAPRQQFLCINHHGGKG